MKKKPARGPELPPGRACFPQWLEGVGSRTSTETNLTKTDRKRIAEKETAGATREEALRELLAEKLAAKLASMTPKEAERYLRDLLRQPSYAKHARNLKHYVRWLAVHHLHETSGRSLDSIFEDVANVAIPPVDGETIRASYELVERARQAGRTSQFFVG